METTRHLAGLAAGLLGAGSAASAPGGAPVEGLVLLAGQVAEALGVARPAGVRTLHVQDNLPLRLLLEERRLLGTESDSAAIDAALRTGSLILAARGAAAPNQAERGVSLLLSTDTGAAMCVFTHDAALRRYAAGAPVTAWVTDSRKAWQFALQVVHREVLLDPGEPSELRLGESRLRRLLA